MKKNIKKEIKKEYFDDLELPLGLWDRIETSLSTAKRRKRRSRNLKVLAGIAAAIALMVVVRSITPIFTSPNSLNHVADYELTLENSRYSELVSQRKEQLLQIKQFDATLYANYTAQLEEMVANYRILEKEYRKTPSKNSVLRAMILNLKMQLQVINNQLEVLEYINTPQTTNGHEKI